MLQHIAHMNWQIAIRALGIVSLIVFAGLTAQYGLGERELLLLIVAIVAVSAPESLDKLPVGPNKE
jgi:hypothetical protein